MQTSTPLAIRAETSRAILTGVEVISEKVGLKLENADISLLGQACKVVVTEDETTIVDGASKVEQISGRVNQIRNEMTQLGTAGFRPAGRGRCRPHARPWGRRRERRVQ
jgi:chaperonin GroEL (HSP60 family)